MLLRRLEHLLGRGIVGQFEAGYVQREQAEVVAMRAVALRMLI
jgi:hypothetical protein